MSSRGSLQCIKVYQIPVLLLKKFYFIQVFLNVIFTAEKVFVFGVILVRISRIQTEFGEILRKLRYSTYKET